MTYDLHSFGSDAELAQAAARQWLEIVAEAGRKRTSHFVALSGGRITKTFFTQIVAQAQARSISLHPVHFFWADERCLPPNHAESNFKMAQELLFQPWGVAAGRIHRLKGELPPEIAVVQANAELRQIVPPNAPGGPVLDLVLLGLGEDGHVASLFPGASAAVEKCEAPFLAITDSPKPPPQRLTLSYAAIAAAHDVWVLASGRGKEAALRESLAENGATPLAKVLRSRTQTKILTDVRS